MRGRGRLNLYRDDFRLTSSTIWYRCLFVLVFLFLLLRVLFNGIELCNDSALLDRHGRFFIPNRVQVSTLLFILKHEIAPATRKDDGIIGHEGIGTKHGDFVV